MLPVGRDSALGRVDYDDMSWAVPPKDVKEVNRAGRELAKRTFPMETDDALRAINNWRSSHAFPLNTFQNGLRRRSLALENDIIVAQRIKRLESIHAKLTREQTETMRLSQMQDIGGCRVVFESSDSVFALVKKYKDKRFAHKFKGEKDYISNPKPDGYRSYHLVYEYRGRGHSICYNGLKIEIQIRTKLQHAWATAVEAVGIFTGQALKSNQGDEDWRRFFALMGTAIAAIEGTPSIPGTPKNKSDLINEITELSRKLKARDRLKAYTITLSHTEEYKNTRYYVMRLEFGERMVYFLTYNARQSQEANEQYTDLERKAKEGGDTQVVLVSVDSIAALRRAYPNYFLDTERFGKLIDRVLRGQFPMPIAPVIDRATE
jgi:hypothetical protein